MVGELIDRLMSRRRRYPHLAARVFGVPLMIEERKLQVILNVLGPRLEFDPPAVSGENGNGAAMMQTQPEYALRGTGVRVIEVTGTLVNRYATAPSGVTSYDELRDELDYAVADPETKGILLRIESYGGEVSGVFDLADAIRVARETKRVWAAIDDNAYSAAYLIASQAERIFASRTGGSGSVGVIAMHYDYSRWAEKEGIKPTAIYAGKRKTEYSPWSPLDQEAVDSLQTEIDGLYEQFVAYVARGRSLEPERIRTTEARTYTGRDGIEIGFVDEIATFREVVDKFLAELESLASVSIGGLAATTLEEVTAMAETNEQTTTLAVDVVDASSICAEAIAPERARIAAILRSEEARGREQLALALALETDHPAETAIRLLAAAPKSIGTDPLGCLMAEVPNPTVGTDSGEQSDADLVAQIVGLGKERA